MKNGQLFVFGVLFTCIISSCTNDKDNEDAQEKYVAPLSSIADISLNYHATSKSVTLSRDVEAEGATVSLNRKETRSRLRWKKTLLLMPAIDLIRLLFL